MEKDRVTEYWDNEIKRAAENTAKAYAEYQQARKEEEDALDLKVEAEANQGQVSEEEAYNIYRWKSLISFHKWAVYTVASRWEGITREAADRYKRRKTEKEANK